MIKKKKIVIAVIGKAQHGKDTMVNFLMKKVPNSEHVSFAKHLKEQAKMLGWDGKKDVAGRTFLQQLSSPVKEYFSAKAEEDEEKYGLYKDDNYYSGIVLKQILESDKENFFISDMRFLCEYHLFQMCPEIDFKVVYVKRINQDGTWFDNGLTPAQKAHISETEHLAMHPDYSCTICTLEDSKRCADEIVNDVWGNEETE